MLMLGGGPALTPFNIEKLSTRVAERGLELGVCSAHFFYLVESGAALSNAETDILENLLEASQESAQERILEGNPIRIIPRFGTRSPWSTKATDIARHCGLKSIEIIERGIVWRIDGLANTEATRDDLVAFLHDPMTESVVGDPSRLEQVFAPQAPAPLGYVDVINGGLGALEAANEREGFALSQQECEYLAGAFVEMNRNPTDAELMMFAQVNSEHCRHKIFNAQWTLDDVVKDTSLFEMVRTTHARNGEKTLSAYSDNAAVIRGYPASWFLPLSTGGEYGQIAEPMHLVIKVETHNHPTAISPFPGAATGSGGEIRDEGATGRGGKPKVGVTGFSVSDLRLPGALMPWELPHQSPTRIASPLQIMLEGPIGAASFNNEFGRPNVSGYFRTLEVASDGENPTFRYGYHKPIMIAGGLGNIRDCHVQKEVIPSGAQLVVLGGPAMLIGLGGGAASSVDSGESDEALDFASVQRGNAEMQRRCQEVIDRCIALGPQNPIISLHDVGAGGLSNALPELVHDAGLGARFDLSAIPSDEPGLSPMQVWCNEAQERYVLAVAPEKLESFKSLCARERCLFSIVGEADAEEVLRLVDPTLAKVQTGATLSAQSPVDLPMPLLFGNAPRMHRKAVSRVRVYPDLDLDGVVIRDALERVLRLPAVADKTFLITIGDRSVGGQVVRDQMVGPWQVPVADAGITTAGFDSQTGEAISMGERTPLALVNAPASGRMAVAEAITNIACAGISELSDVHLCANWMAAAGEAGQDADLFQTVQAVTLDLCPALGISIPVGKDSMSMSSRWTQNGDHFSVSSPMSLIITAFAPVADVRRSVTPVLETTQESVLLLIDLARGKNRLGGSALAQVFGQIGNEVPDLDHPEDLRAFFAATRELLAHKLALAYHDRSDGGLVVALMEMAFASRCSLEIDIGNTDDALAMLFSEEPGAVIQVSKKEVERVQGIFEKAGIGAWVRPVGSVIDGSDHIRIVGNDTVLLEASRAGLHQAWSELTSRMQGLRDNPECTVQEVGRLKDLSDPGLSATLTFDPAHNPATRAILGGQRPRLAVLREQGVNGHMEMAAAFDRAGFAAVDVTMSDLQDGRHHLKNFQGLVACGGFSFGDVLGAGQGWAKSILFEPMLRHQFEVFFAREEIFALGVCNGCQMMAALKDLIPGAQHWPHFGANQSGQFESRVIMVEVLPSDSVLFEGMAGTRIPVVVAHGEGRAQFSEDTLATLRARDQVSLRFVDNYGRTTDRYPFNPNGSMDGVTGLCAADGRVTIMMPHPERNFRTVTNSWHPKDWNEHSPWLRIFQNARAFVG